MRTFSYPVLAFRQQVSAPVQVAFVAHAGEILEWAGVPRKSDELLTGYQRFRDDKRVDQEIVPFFSDQRNCSPTAIIVALRGDSGLGRCHLDPSVVEPGKIVQGTLTIQFDDAKIGTDAVLEAAARYVQGRLATSLEGNGRNERDNEEDEGEDGEEEGEAEDEETIAHLGTVTLARLKELLDDRANRENPHFRGNRSA
jgi:hypothetical protein